MMGLWLCYKTNMHLLLATCCMIHLHTILAASRTRNMAGTRGLYCTSPGLRQTAARSALLCARDCSNDVQCVAYSQRVDSQCLLHADFCSPANLLADEGSLYTGDFS